MFKEIRKTAERRFFYIEKFIISVECLTKLKRGFSILSVIDFLHLFAQF